MSVFEFAIRLFAALLLGAAVGVERQWRQKNAGLRTNTLVSLGAAAFVLLSIEIGGDATGRIASYVVSGIGFLGAGVIMKDDLVFGCSRRALRSRFACPSICRCVGYYFYTPDLSSNRTKNGLLDF